jgi:thioredoxin-related protein
MKNWRTKLDTIANIALIICCVLFAGFLIRNYLLTSNRQNTNTNPQANSFVGKRLPINFIDWSKNQQTLMLVLQKNCRFCNESMPFYQRLAKELSNQTKTRLVAVLPQSLEESKQYLKENKVEINDVLQASPNSVGVRGTPTLVLIDNDGIVQEQWVGKQSPAKEESVIARLKQ